METAGQSGPEGDERALEDPPGGRHGEIGRSERRPGKGRQRGDVDGRILKEREKPNTSGS